MWVTYDEIRAKVGDFTQPVRGFTQKMAIFTTRPEKCGYRKVTRKQKIH